MTLSIERYRKASESIIRLMSKVLPKEHNEFRVQYSGRSVIVNGKDTCTYIYIRVTYTDHGFIADIANIDLDESIQHKGIFTSIINELSKSRSISGIWVSSVLTEEMHNACKKLNMQVNKRINGYELLW